ncbi:MAG: type IV pilus biogenesis/stability protein PilW [Amphritea sp.]
MKHNLIILFCLFVAGCAGQESSSSGPSAGDAAQAYTQLGMQYLRSGESASAKKAFQRAQEIDDSSVASYNGLAMVFQLEDEPELAEKYFKQAVALAPDSAMLHNNYGAFLFSLARYKEACRELARATEDPFYNRRGQAFENLGRCYQLMERDDAAEHAFKRSLKLDSRRPVSLIELSNVLLNKGETEAAINYFNQFSLMIDAKQVKHTAKSLWLGVRIARAQNDAVNAATYGLILRSLYPESIEYSQYKESTP